MRTEPTTKTPGPAEIAGGKNVPGKNTHVQDTHDLAAGKLGDLGSALITGGIGVDLELTADFGSSRIEPLPGNGGAISIETLDGSVFDSIVFAERESNQWMAGSNNFVRTAA